MAYIAVNETAEFVRLELNADGVDYSANIAVAFDGAGSANVLTVPAMQEVTSVSYTHLTLPTKRIV